MTVDQILIALRRAAANDYSWSVSPHEAAALVAEVERLRAEVDLLRTGREAARNYADRVEAEVVALRGERAAVVAWLRAEAYLTLYKATPSDVADAIERGEHRREEEK
jgi:hypothetical protein